MECQYTNTEWLAGAKAEPRLMPLSLGEWECGLVIGLLTVAGLSLLTRNKEGSKMQGGAIKSKQETEKASKEMELQRDRGEGVMEEKRREKEEREEW